MNAVAIIPARGNSRRVPRKNIRDFHGKPIIAYSIDAARESGLFDRIIVSTDDEEIASVAIDCGAEAMMRSAEMARDEVGTQDVMRCAVKDLFAATLDNIACCIYPCAPMLSAASLCRAERVLRHLGHRVDYVVPVGEWLQDPGQFYMGWATSFALGVPLLYSGTVVMDIDPRTAIDINTEEDWQLAEAMFNTLRGERA